MSGFTQPPLLSKLFACLARLRLAVTEPGLLREDLVRNDRLEAFLWLSTLLLRLNGLIALLRKGPLPPPRPQPSPAPGQGRSPALALSPQRLPRGAWLAQALPTSADLALLRAYLAHPDLQPLFAQEPTRFARLLRPLCRAAGCPLPAALTQTPSSAPNPQPQAPAQPDPPEEPAFISAWAPPRPKLSRRQTHLTSTTFDLSPLLPTLLKKS